MGEPQDAKPVANPTAPISDRDRKRLLAILYGRAKELGIEKKVMTDQFHAWLTEMHNVHRTEQITNANYERIIAAVQAWPAQADQPTAQEIFGEDKVPF